MPIFHKERHKGHIWWHTSINLTLDRLSQEDHSLKRNLRYMKGPRVYY